MKRFRRGLIFKARRLLYHSTLGSRVIKKKKRFRPAPPGHTLRFRTLCLGLRGMNECVSLICHAPGIACWRVSGVNLALQPLIYFNYGGLIDSGLVDAPALIHHIYRGMSPITFSLGGVQREQKMLKGHLSRVIYHQVY